MEYIAPEYHLIFSAYVLQRVAAREQWIAPRHLSSDPEQTGQVLAVLGGRQLYRKAEPGMVVRRGGDAQSLPITSSTTSLVLVWRPIPLMLMVQECIEPSSTVMTNEHIIYKSLKERGYDHHTVNHDEDEYTSGERNEIHTHNYEYRIGMSKW